MKKMEPTEDVSAATQDVDLLRARNFEAIKQRSSPAMINDETDSTLASMADAFPNEQPIAITTVGFNGLRMPDFYKSSITLQYQFSNAWVLAQVNTRQADGSTWIEGFHVQQMPESIQELNRFTFAGKGMSQFVVFFLAIASFSVCIYAFIVCLKTRIAKRKWLWLIAVWVGLVCVSVNWTTGEADYRVIAINLPTLSATSTPYGPWIIGAFFPLGAVLFLWRKDQLASSAAISVPAVVENETTQIQSENPAPPSTG